METADARQLLAVQAAASLSDLKSAYRRMLKLWHPDRFAPDSPEYSEAIRRTQRINAAYRLLEGDLGTREFQLSDTQAPSAPAWKRSPIRTVVGEWWPIILSVVVVGLSWGISVLLA